MLRAMALYGRSARYGMRQRPGSTRFVNNGAQRTNAKTEPVEAKPGGARQEIKQSDEQRDPGSFYPRHYDDQLSHQGHGATRDTAPGQEGITPSSRF